jgi:hypothetical protein
MTYWKENKQLLEIEEVHSIEEKETMKERKAL